MKKNDYFLKAFGYILVCALLVVVIYLGFESESTSSRGNIFSKEENPTGFFGQLLLFAGGAILCFCFAVNEIIKYFKSKK